MLRLGIIVFLAALLMPLSAQAGCSPTLSGSSRERMITISDCDHPAMMILTSDFSKSTDGGIPRQPVSFASQCKKTSTGFWCRRNGQTPLAGSAYRYTHDTNPTCEGQRAGIRLTCVKACTAKIPKYLYITPWEC